MDRFLRWIGLAAMAFIVLIAAFVAVFWIWRLPIWKGVDSGWVQAFFGPIGISIAIWVPYKQRADTLLLEEARRQDEARRVQLAIRDELQSLQRAFSGPNVVYLLAKNQGEIFERFLPIPAQRFPIFAAMLDRLTLIADDNLRTEILGAYEMANALIACGQENNRMLLDCRDTEVEVQYRPDAFQRGRLEFQNAELQKMCMQMQEICKRTMLLVNALVPKL